MGLVQKSSYGHLAEAAVFLFAADVRWVISAYRTTAAAWTLPQHFLSQKHRSFFARRPSAFATCRLAGKLIDLHDLPPGR